MIYYNIPYEFCNYLQRLSYEVQAYQDMLSFMLSKKMEKELFEEYNKEYLNIFLEYSLAKSELEKQLKENFPNLKNFTWVVDFIKQICEVTIIED